MLNQRFFSELSTEAIDSYRQHGYVCLRGLIPQGVQELIQTRWEQLCADYAADLQVDAGRYLSVISQWRDLWKADPFFGELLATYLAPAAAGALELPGARLLHDHFIRKDGTGSNGVIPWHQDSMFWPVDRTGLSTWLALDSAQINQGCLQVIAGSHLWQTETPVDFMSQEVDMSGQPVTWLPVEAGDVVVLDSKIWHRSDPVDASAKRLAHIALWVPEQTRYAPTLADWHPLNDQISVNEGELLNEDEFPVYGGRSQALGSSQTNAHAGVQQHRGMFNARARVESTVRQQLARGGSLGELLSDPDSRENLSGKLAERGTLRLEQCLHLVDDLWISAAAYEKHRSRNVFNDAYARWDAQWTE